MVVLPAFKAARRVGLARACVACLCVAGLWGSAAPTVARGEASGVVPASSSAPAPRSSPFPSPGPQPAQGLIAADLELAPVVPGDPAWRLGPVRQPGLAALVAVDEAVRAPTGAASFRVDYELAAGPQAQDFFGVESAARRNLYKARGVEFAVRASRPLLAVLVITTSNPERPEQRDSFFGSFVVGTEWKQLHIRFRSMAPAPGQAAQTGDQVLRPDSIEHIGIGLPKGRAPAGSGSLWLGDVRFFR